MKNATCLSVTFDKYLSFDCHINNLIKKGHCDQLIRILAKVKPFLNTKALLNLYYAIFHSHLQYGLITWSSTFKTYLKKFSTLHKLSKQKQNSANVEASPQGYLIITK